MADTSVSYKCPQCGAPLSFLPGHDKVTCEYCGSEYTVAEIEKLFAAQEAKAAAAGKAEAAQAVKEAAEQKGEQSPATAGGEWEINSAGSQWDKGETDSFQTFVCSSCGAELVADGNTIATECCYCGNPTLIPQRFEGALKPDFVIPFQKTKAEAVAALKGFYAGKKLLPDAFTANNRMEAIQGLYVPFWLYDTKVHALRTYTGTNRSSYVEGNNKVEATEYYNCTREGEMAFAKIPADGSKKMNDAYMDSIEPFDYNEMIPFTTAYLTGYLADKYDVTAEENTARIDERVAASMAEAMDGTLNFESVDLEESQIEKVENAVKYALVPVWILTTKYQGQPYTFMMNGQTGKFIGSLPIDSGKEKKYMAMAFGGGFVVLMLLVKLIAWFL